MGRNKDQEIEELINNAEVDAVVGANLRDFVGDIPTISDERLKEILENAIQKVTGGAQKK